MRENCWGMSCEKSRFYANFFFFFNFRGAPAGYALSKIRPWDPTVANWIRAGGDQASHYTTSTIISPAVISICLINHFERLHTAVKLANLSLKTSIIFLYRRN